METTIPAKRKFSNICTVTLYVGTERTRFDVHQDHLCEVSSFFKAAFTSQFKEGCEKALDLLDDDVDTVNLFVQWLYERQCDPFTMPNDEDGEYLMQPMRLLIFADKYGVPTLQKYTFTKLITHFNQPSPKNFSDDVTIWVYNNTCAGSGIRRLIADWTVINCKRMWFQLGSTQKWLRQQPEFAVDLIVAFSALPDDDYVPEQLKNELSEYYMETKVEDNDDSSSDESASTCAGR